MHRRGRIRLNTLENVIGNFGEKLFFAISKLNPYLDFACPSNLE